SHDVYARHLDVARADSHVGRAERSGGRVRRCNDTATNAAACGLVTENPIVRVLFNGVTLLKPKTGIAHAAANVHAALVANYPADTFWLYPGATASRLAPRFFKPKNTPTETAKKPNALKQLAKHALGSVAKLGYAAHFQTTARLGRFDLYHEPNFVPFRTG